MVPTGISGARQIADESTTHYDDRFEKLDNLTWLPWVGARVPQLETGRRVLIVGESHYSNEPAPAKVGKHIASLLADRSFTRNVVRQCPVNLEWRNPTLENIGRFLLGTRASDRRQLWSELAFYNFVQRPMAYAARKERPTWEDWVRGWNVFEGVVSILKPAHCIFIGVTAANAFNWAMTNSSASFQPVQRLVKVRRTWARAAQITVGKHTIALSFMRHCGAHFSWLDWHAFLKTRCGTVIDHLKERNLFRES